MKATAILAGDRVNPLPFVAAVALAVLSTVLALRLLGVRRGWGKTLLSGAIGWGAAGLLALRLADWNRNANGLVLHTFAMALPATMAVAVTLDLLARPGTLATGERAGLFVTPRLARAVQRQVRILLRYRELLGLARRHGFGPLPSSAGREDRANESEAVRLRRVLEEAGGVYVKLGQIAATRVDLLPTDVCDEMAKLQNSAPPEPVELVRPVLEAELGVDPHLVFSEFEWEPLAAASIGQTHRAVLRSGEPVVVKIQRPGIAGIIDRDLAALALLANVAQRRTQFGQGLRTGEMMRQFAQGMRAELDFRKEADAMVEMALLATDRSAVRIPRVYKEYCTGRLLVQERFEGFTVADRAELDRSGIDRDALAMTLLRSTLDQVLKYGFFHADPHPGNIFVLSDGSLGLIDFGAVGRLDPIQQSAVLDILLALKQRDVSLLRDALERVVDFTETSSPEQLERALARLLADHVRLSGTVEPTVLQDLVALLSRFGIRLPTDLVVLSRALVTVDGTLRVIARDFSLVAAATETLKSTTEPVLDSQTMVRDELVAMLPHLRRLPERVDRILALTGKGELRVRNVVDEDSRRILRTLVNRGILAFVGSAFAFVSVLLLVSTDAGPPVAKGVGLFEVLGYGGLLAGTVLLLRIAAMVARDGTT